MAYRISYDANETKPGKRVDLKKIAIIFMVVAVIACAITINTVGLGWVRRVLLPGDPAVTAAALDEMLSDIRDGVPIVEALKTFCQEIVAHAA